MGITGPEGHALSRPEEVKAPQLGATVALQSDLPHSFPAGAAQSGPSSSPGTPSWESVVEASKRLCLSQDRGLYPRPCACSSVQMGWESVLGTWCVDGRIEPLSPSWSRVVSQN